MNRRDFLTGSIAGAAITSLPFWIFQRENEEPDESVPKFAYVVQDQRGRAAIRYLVQFPDDSDYDKVLYESTHRTFTMEESHSSRWHIDPESDVSVTALNTDSERSKLLAEFNVADELESANSGISE